MASNPDFYMNVPFLAGDPETTGGKIDYSSHPGLLGLADADLTGMRVLDIATQDGFWAFWAEERGAREVVALDVDSIHQMDWDRDGPNARSQVQYRSNSLGWTDTESGFWYLHSLRGSDVRRVSMSVYELEPARVGAFDLIFMHGLLYHLRYPLYALDRVRAVTLGSLVLETHVIMTNADLPHGRLYKKRFGELPRPLCIPFCKCNSQCRKGQSNLSVMSNIFNDLLPLRWKYKKNRN